MRKQGKRATGAALPLDLGRCMFQEALTADLRERLGFTNTLFTYFSRVTPVDPGVAGYYSGGQPCFSFIGTPVMRVLAIAYDLRSAALRYVT